MTFVRPSFSDAFFSIFAFGQSPQIKGTWTVYSKDGVKNTNYNAKIVQIDGVTMISIVGQRGRALITGNKITVGFIRYYGTIRSGGTRIDWSDGGFQYS